MARVLAAGCKGVIAMCAAVLFSAVLCGQSAEIDTDGDGLSDFQEIHKYRTDPMKADSKGDGIKDGDRDRRRAFTYTIRAVVRVMRPVTPEYLNDDFQDVRVLAETPTYIDLEVIHYPFSTAGEAIVGDAAWRTKTGPLAEWVRPGLTSNGDAALGRRIAADMKAAGIDVASLDDAGLVRKAAAFVGERTRYQPGFTAFFVGFTNSKPGVSDELMPAVRGELAVSGLALEEQWNREIFASSMYDQRTRGDCTSSAIYLCGCLRALGIPSRIVLGIPLVDPSMAEQLSLIHDRFTNHRVRQVLLDALSDSGNLWCSHTFNEVWVGGRWRRLNYWELGPAPLQSGYFGLMTHVATFKDWSVADMPKTVGRRQALHLRDATFAGANPYRTLELSDQFGKFCSLPNPPAESKPAAESRPEVHDFTIARVFWSDAPGAPAFIRDAFANEKSITLIGQVKEGWAGDRLKSFTEHADARFSVIADGPTPAATLDVEVGSITCDGDGFVILQTIPQQASGWLLRGKSYRLVPRNEGSSFRWHVDADLRVMGR